MTLGQSRNSVLAVVPEVTEGTPVDPTGTTDYVALQPDATLSPSFDLLQNEEIRASIGKAKPIQGLEHPEMSFSHYLKHSGTEGTAPEISDLLKAAFGTETVNGTQRTLTSGSTTSVLALASGGSDFSRGMAVLVKDGTNGYAIRPVQSMSTNSMTLGFNVGVAPATGVTLGKCVNYTPANSGHQSVSMWMYRGNGQLIEMIAGGKVTEFGFSASAGEFINANFSVAGTKYHFNPIRITSATRYLDFTDDDGTVAAVLAVKVYRDPNELAQAVTDAMNTANPGETHTCSYSSSTGKFTILSTGTVLSLLFASGTNTANTIATKLGYTAVDKTGTAATTGYASQTAQTYAAPHTPAYDAADPLVAKNQEILIGDATDTTMFEAQSVAFTLSNEKSDVTSICAESGVNSVRIKGREVKVKITALLDKWDTDKFRRYRANTDTRFAWNFGSKSGGNWEAGKCGCFYMPTCTISTFNLVDLDGVVGLEIELTSFVDSSGNGEAYLNFL